MDRQEAEALGRSMLAAMAERDHDAMSALLGDDVRWWFPVSICRQKGWDRPVVGREAVLERVLPATSGFAPGTTTYDVHQVLADDDWAVLVVERRATTSDGRPYAVEYHFHLRRAGDRIVEVRDMLDTLLATGGG